MIKNFLTDKQLVDTYQQSSGAESFQTLYKQYMGAVYRKCLTMTHDPEAAQDFTQDIFIKVFHKLDTFENRSGFSTWLYAISHNYCLDRMRLGKRLTTQPLSDELTAGLADGDGSDTREEQLTGLQTVLADFGAEELTLLQLKYEQGWSVQAIAQHYQLTKSAVKMRLKRSRDRLQILYMQRIE